MILAYTISVAVAVAIAVVRNLALSSRKAD